MVNKSPALFLQGINENNLKNLTLSLDHDRLVTITGLSGSGKSTLAFDTIYAEGQRRYLETFSPYVRQFLDKIKKPDIAGSDFLRPTIAIAQKTKITSSRSTVGSLTDINDYMAIIFANLATPIDPDTGLALQRTTPARLVKVLKTISAPSFLITAPLTLTKVKKQLAEDLKTYEQLGYFRFCLEDSDKIYNLNEDYALLSLGTKINFVVDRLKADKQSPARINSAAEQAYRLSRGILQIITPDNTRTTYTEFFSRENDPAVELRVPAARIGFFQSGNPLGACKTCNGFGSILVPDISKVIQDTNLSLADGVISFWTGKAGNTMRGKLKKFAADNDISFKTAWSELPKSQQDLIINHKTREYPGVRGWFANLSKKAYKTHVRVFLARYRMQEQCPDCHGSGLIELAQYFRLGGHNHQDIQKLELADVSQWLNGLKVKQSDHELSAVYKNLTARIEYLLELGLSYLSLDRPARTLSGGETQRVNLAAAIGSELVSTQFVLDEPTVGLHPRDTGRLLQSIRRLQRKNNSVLVVEHDLDAIKFSDQVIELGPLAGTAGGEIVYQGTAAKWLKQNSGRFTMTPAAKLPARTKTVLKIKNAKMHNLKSANAEIKENVINTLIGVSGSGKSSLVKSIIAAAEKELHGRISSPQAVVSGLQNFAKVIAIDQSSLAKSPRANIATYSGIWDQIRATLADTALAKQKLLTKSSFSFNVAGGRCPNCDGLGDIKEEMQFLHAVYVKCDACLGKRFQQGVLEVTALGKNVWEWLGTTVSECAEIFTDNQNILRLANYLELLGLGHLTLGRSLSELSGGEAQRLKLVPYLEQSEQTTSLLIFDEPTTGLHHQDVHRLLTIFDQLIDKGHTLLCVEHNPEVVLKSNYLVELGPEAGRFGGEVVFSGSAAQLLKAKTITAHYLQEYVRDFGKPVKVQSNQKKIKQQKSDFLEIEHAKEHNLKDISLKIPHNKLVAITGVSGSGKSTIAKDIIFAEGQRKYLDCLSPYARHFIKELKKPAVGSITNLRPTICVYQHTFQPGKLSTVGTMSEVYNFLRLLFSKSGDQFCSKHPDTPVTIISAEDLLKNVQAFGKKEIRLIAPIIIAKKGNHQQVFVSALEQDIHEVRVDGKFGKTTASLDGLSRHQVHSVDYVWASLIPDRVPSELLLAAIAEITTKTGGSLIVNDGKKDHVYSTKRGCPICNTGYLRPDPEDFSFNSRRGRCPECEGSGQKINGQVCNICDGSRLKPESLLVKLAGANIHELSQNTLTELADFLGNFKLPPNKQALASPIIAEITDRLQRLINLGMNYLPLARSCRSLSKGELQRLRLANAMGSPLSGVLYIFDEPSAGLHPFDNRPVLQEFGRLTERANSVLLIEHEAESIAAAEHVLEVGPGGGQAGGEIVANSAAVDYDYGHPAIIRAEEPFLLKKQPKLKLKKITVNNINNLSLDLPLQSLITIAGVSGSGKSSLINTALLETIGKDLGKNFSSWTSEYGKISSALQIDRLLVVDQKPIGKNSRSTPASYLKIWDEIRTLLAATPVARSRGWGPSFFSYNAKNSGRCPECSGMGTKKLEMNFLAEARVVCPICAGRRFTDDALTAKYAGFDASEILNMTFEDLKDQFKNHQKTYRLAKAACELGIGYLNIGQSSATLSGGESQRIKLSQELSAKQRGHTLYLLDEPTVGLHHRDVAKLLTVLRSLVARGDTVILIEHDSQVIASADHVVELGPGPDANGGKVIFEGNPAELEVAKTPWGRILGR